MLAENQKVIVKWNGVNRKYYESNGYIFTEMGNEFEIDVNDLIKTSTIKVRFICDYCNGENQIDEKSKYKQYRDLLRYRKTSNKDCCVNMNCRSKKVRESQILNLRNEKKTFGDMFPLLLKEWSDKNEKNPYMFTPHSAQVVWWICEKGHEWEEKIVKRTHGSKCKECGDIIRFNNRLIITHPELCEEWNYKRNKITIDEVTKGSAKVVWWIGKCGHEWDDQISNRTRGNNCPYCSGMRVNDTNCLANLRPDLLLEWDYDKNNGIISPYEVACKSNKEAWWKCLVCSHEWKASMNQRSKSGCEVCSESKGEKRIRKWLKHDNFVFESQKEFEGLIGTGGRNLSYDFYLPEYNLLIEYQGSFHDGSGGEYTEQNLEKQQEHDKRKREYTKQNGIDLLEVWYWDFDNIEEILTNKFIELQLLKYPTLG